MINFLRYKRLYFIISLGLLVISVVSLSLWKLQPSIDFTGGTIIELDSKVSCQLTTIHEALGEKDPGLVSTQAMGEGTCILRFSPLNDNQKNSVTSILEERFGEIRIVRFETVGPILGKELLTKTLFAVVLAIGFIMFYAAWQFKDKRYGICAILAMLHDTLILLGCFSLLGHFFGVEVDILFVTAVLTTLSFSVHDTVVVFNSIREAAGGPGTTDSNQQFEQVVNMAINATVVRSLNNSFTIIFMLLCLFLLGGQTIRWFSVALLVGTVLGTYSSTFVAAPLLTIWRKYLR